MGWADKVAGSDVSGGGVYFLEGVYPTLWIERCQLKTSRKGKELFIAEFKILQSNVEGRGAGSEVSQVYNLTDHEAAAGNVKAFIGAAMDDDAFAHAKMEDMTPEERADFIKAVQDVVGESNPLKGRLVRAEASVIQTRAKTDFTLVKFSGLPEAAQAKAMALYEAAGFAPF